jgi:hypothetical protein
MKSPTDFTDKPDKIENSVFQNLKPLDFKKKGRTFNREAERGIYQVINFQSGQFPIGSQNVIPGLNENYCQFGSLS